MSIETVIYIYIFVCCSVIIYNIAYIFYIEHEKKDEIKMRKWIKKVLIKELKQDRQYRKELFKRLKDITFFNLYVDALMEKEESIKENYIKENAFIFNVLVKEYRNKEEIIQTCFAYDISRLHMCDYGNEDLMKMLMKLVVSTEPYCRESALLAFYNCHHYKYIIKSLLVLDRMKIYHYDKLLIDGILSYLGDLEQLGWELLGIYSELSIQYKIIVLNVLKGISGCYCQDIYNLYKIGYEEVDINIVIYRYFSKWYYEPFLKELIFTLSDKETSWEMRAIGAFSLRNYSCEEVVMLLKKTSEDRNWYVRYNSVESLLAITHNGDHVVIEDRYGQDIFDYLRQRNHLMGGNL